MLILCSFYANWSTAFFQALARPRSALLMLLSCCWNQLCHDTTSNANHLSGFYADFYANDWRLGYQVGITCMNTTFKATSMRFANDLNIRPDETLLYLYVDSACIDVVSLRIQFHQPESSGPARRVKGHSIQHGSVGIRFFNPLDVFHTTIKRIPKLNLNID